MSHTTKNRLKNIGRALGIIVITGFIAYLLLNNIAPYGTSLYYSSSGKDNSFIGFGPKDRVQQKTYANEVVFEQTHDIMYFTTKMPFQFDEAMVRLTFNNPNPEQTLYVGFQDKPVWHYDKKLFDVPFLNNLAWDTIGSEPTLYQRKKTFNSVEDFLKKPPKQSLIGTYEYDTNIGTLETKIVGYVPQQKETIIDTPLRGKHMMYAYVENEPFTITFTKQDLNWYEDPDTVAIKIYKEDALVYQKIITDDGIVDNSHMILPPQEVTIQNPGPDLPESGVYKVVIDANDDTVIHSIKTNLQKIVFAGQLFLAKNHEAYPAVFASTSATTLYTNALMLSGITYHEPGQQRLFVGDEIVDLNGIENEQVITPKNDFTQITATKNDVTLNMFNGYSAFSPEQFFLPSTYHVFPVTKKSDTALTDYIIAYYKPSQKNGAWRTNENTFNLTNAFVKNNQLSWAIIAPKLSESKQKIHIKKVEVILKKNSLL